QIKNFMGHLRAGLDADHASLGAIIESEGDDGANPRMLVRNILEDSDVSRRGLDIGDELVSFSGRRMSTVNQFKNALGLYPRGWGLPRSYRRNDAKSETLVRLMGVQRMDITDDKNPMPVPQPAPRPMPGPRPTPGPAKPSPVAKFFEAKPGFANYYFNKQMTDRLWKGFQKHGDFNAKKAQRLRH